MRLPGNPGCPQDGWVKVKLQFAGPALPGSLSSLVPVTEELCGSSVHFGLGLLSPTPPVPHPSQPPSSSRARLQSLDVHLTANNMVTIICSSHSPLAAHTAGRMRQSDSTQDGMVHDRAMHFTHSKASRAQAQGQSSELRSGQSRALENLVLFASSHLPRNICGVAPVVTPNDFHHILLAHPSVRSVPFPNMELAPSYCPCRLSTGMAWCCVRRQLRSKTQLSQRQTSSRQPWPFSARS